MRDDVRAELVYGGNGVRGREGHGGDLQHRDIIFVVADAVNVLARHAEERREPQDHAALGRAGGGQLEQMLVGVDQLILPPPRAREDESPHGIKHWKVLFKKDLDDGQINVGEALHHLHGRAGQMLVVADVAVGIHRVDAAVVMVDLEGERREPREHLSHVVVDRLAEKRGVEVFIGAEVVDRRAVGDDARRAHRHVLGVVHERGQRAAGGDGEQAAILDEVVQRLAVARTHGRDVGAVVERGLGVDERVVKVAGEQHMVEFLHGEALSCRFLFLTPQYTTAAGKSNAFRAAHDLPAHGGKAACIAASRFSYGS